MSFDIFVTDICRRGPGGAEENSIGYRERCRGARRTNTDIAGRINDDSRCGRAARIQTQCRSRADGWRRETADKRGGRNEDRPAVDRERRARRPGPNAQPLG